MLGTAGAAACKAPCPAPSDSPRAQGRQRIGDGGCNERVASCGVGLGKSSAVKNLPVASWSDRAYLLLQRTPRAMLAACAWLLHCTVAEV